MASLERARPPAPTAQPMVGIWEDSRRKAGQAGAKPNSHRASRREANHTTIAVGGRRGAAAENIFLSTRPPNRRDADRAEVPIRLSIRRKTSPTAVHAQ